MPSWSVCFMFPVHPVKKRNFHAFFETEIFEEKYSYKEQHQHPENCIFSKKLVNKYYENRDKMHAFSHKFKDEFSGRHKRNLFEENINLYWFVLVYELKFLFITVTSGFQPKYFLCTVLVLRFYSIPY
ncbi:hypothetical protein SDC9_135805 [bioreactor metagenome]|uniref:Uncharacterized protein n=1 Tax=bioreactor metagenome TaxID=1076179 RepID=A0A645DHI2_9ZZZZ